MEDEKWAKNCLHNSSLASGHLETWGNCDGYHGYKTDPENTRESVHTHRSMNISDKTKLYDESFTNVNLLSCIIL